MTDLSPDELKTLLAAASPGPWKLVEEHNFDCVLDLGLSATVYDADGDKVCADTVGGLWAMSVEDARLIALAPALAAEVIRLRAECFALAAGACGGHYGDDYGNSRCSLVDVQRTRAEAAEALLREVGEGLRPFARAGSLLEPRTSGWDMVVYAPAAGDEYRIVGDDLRAARALADKIGGGGE